jgi:hypothetical protein
MIRRVKFGKDFRDRFLRLAHFWFVHAKRDVTMRSNSFLFTKCAASSLITFLGNHFLIVDPMVDSLGDSSDIPSFTLSFC